METPSKNPLQTHRARTRDEGGFVLVISLLTLALMSYT